MKMVVSGVWSGRGRDVVGAWSGYGRGVVRAIYRSSVARQHIPENRGVDKGEMVTSPELGKCLGTAFY